MYIIYTKWDDLLSVAVKGQEIYVQHLFRHDHRLQISSITEIIISLHGNANMIRAARLEVERVSMRSDYRANCRAAVEVRGMIAQTIVETALRAYGFTPCAGILLAPGLREDLEHYTLRHTLWRWEHPENELHRQLVATTNIIETSWQYVDQRKKEEYTTHSYQ